MNASRLTAILALVAACSCKACKTDGAGTEDRPDAGGDVKDAPLADSPKSDAGIEAADAFDPADGPGQGDGWQPAGDPGWKTVEWAPDCGVEVATIPSNAVPPLVWKECGDALAGCTMLVPNWPTNLGYPFNKAQVYKQGSVVRLSLHMFFVNEWRKAIWDEGMQTLGAWRGGKGSCGSQLLQWTPDHVCASFANSEPFTSYDALLAPSELSGSPLRLFETKAMIPRACNEHLFSGTNPAGIPYVRNLATGEGMWLQFTDAIGADLRLSGNVAFFMVNGFSGPSETLTGWSWKPPNVVQQIVDPGSQMVFDIRSDGTTLAWIQTTATASYETAPGWLWTSPHTTEPASIVAAKKREVPSNGAPAEMKAIGGGYYALVEQTGKTSEQYVHVYRLSDGHHWKVPTPADVRSADILSIDAEEVWFLGTTVQGWWSTVIRQRLDALGSGD